MTSVTLFAGRERSLTRRHPWIFSGAVARVEGEPQAGDTVEVLDSEGTWLARGAFCPRSQITVRVWSFGPEQEPSAPFFRARLERAVGSRPSHRARAEGQGCRLVNSESDGLPGVVVDRYDEFLVCQFLSAGAERWRETIVAELAEILPARGMYERSDVAVREKEGLQPRTGVLGGEAPPPEIEICEESSRFLVDVRTGQKTGFYLDQRENRRVFAERVEGAEVLNGFSYTGAFGIAALHGGAVRVVNIESSSAALELSERHTALNGIDPARVEHVAGDVFQVLRRYRDAGRQFDSIVLDPPKFADSRAQLPRAARGYKDINLLAFKLLRPGGLLATFSCSGLLAPELFQKIVADAALDAGRDAHIERWLAQADDHPVALAFPEGRYLKGLVCRAW